MTKNKVRNSKSQPVQRPGEGREGRGVKRQGGGRGESRKSNKKWEK